MSEPTPEIETTSGKVYLDYPMNRFWVRKYYGTHPSDGAQIRLEEDGSVYLGYSKNERTGAGFTLPYDEFQKRFVEFVDKLIEESKQ